MAGNKKPRKKKVVKKNKVVAPTSKSADVYEIGIDDWLAQLPSNAKRGRSKGCGITLDMMLDFIKEPVPKGLTLEQRFETSTFRVCAIYEYEQCGSGEPVFEKVMKQSFEKQLCIDSDGADVFYTMMLNFLKIPEQNCW